MPTVIHELADAFLRRKQELAERSQAKTKLAGSGYFMPKSSKQDLANRLSVFEQGGLPELLKQAGKEMYDNPIVNTAIGLTPVVGDIQAAGETVAALQRGAPWQETAGYAVGMLPFVPALRTTWHGSPHGFTKFDMSKVGTGEGAQAYGHGLYLAEARPVAEEYATNLSKDVFNVGGELFNPADIKHLNVRTLARKGDLDNAIKKATELAASDSPVADLARLDLDLLQQAKAKGGFQEAPGYLYKVELPDEQIAKMLDWDKPFSEQPKNVQDAITKYWQENRVYGDPTKLTGEGIYGSLQAHVLGNRGIDRANRSAAQEAASMDLNYMGVPGIQYLDQASRGAGEGTRNYVVFSDEIPKILERNGTSVFEFPKD